MTTFESAATLLGGIGLFLLAVKLITDGLRVAAGEALRRILESSTGTPLRGIASGLLITALVQSSSAVTVATLGFVNAGLLSLYQSLGVLYGANVGTTMTGWLVAATGLNFPVESFALPMIGAGMLLRLSGPSRRRGALGEALAGFGLFFIGIDVLRGAFEGITTTHVLDSLPAQTPQGIVLFVLLGFVLTVLTQSSSAAIAMILTAAGGDLLTLAAAAAMVIGANIGTTSAAALASIGATPDARRVAAAHIAFNVLTGAVALLMLPLLLWALRAAGAPAGLADSPALTLAGFHTLFNVLGVAIMWPWTARLARTLSGWFRSAAEDAAQPRHLDPSVAVAPALGLNALVLELDRVRAMSRDTAQTALGAGPPASDAGDIEHGREAMLRLLASVGEFVTLLGRTSLPADIAAQLPRVLRTGQYFDACADAAGAAIRERGRLALLSDVESAHALARFRAAAARALDSLPGAAPDAGTDHAGPGRMEDAYQALKETLLAAGAARRMRIADMSSHLEQASRLRRMVGQHGKGVALLSRIAAHTGQAVSPSTAASV